MTPFLTAAPRVGRPEAARAPVAQPVLSYRDAPIRARLRGPATAEICVVGAGLAGLSAALALARAGRSVIVLEAGRVASGASGRAGGQLLPGYAAPQPLIERLVGLDRARALWDLSVEALDDAAALAARLLPPEALGRGVAIAAARPSHLPTLERLAARLARVYRYDALGLVDAAQMRALLGAEGYAGGLVDRRAAHVDPGSLTRALALEAEAAGVRIFEGSAAVRVAPGLVTTAEGSVAARHVVAAVNAGARALLGWAGRSIVTAHTYMLATAPLPPALAAEVLPAGCAVYDTAAALDYFRKDPNGRLLFGGGIGGGSDDAAAIARRVRRRMLRRFPMLADTPVTHAWSGAVDLTATHLPDVGGAPDGVLHVHGFNGHGLALALRSGQAAAERLLGDRRAWDVMAELPQARLPGPEWLAAGLFGLGMAGRRLKAELTQPGLAAL